MISQQTGINQLNRTFFIADTHFGHTKIIEYEKEYRSFDTIEQHDRELVYRWNSVVKKRDTVWHLGDVLFNSKCFEILAELNGVKNLVMGNHDIKDINKYLKYFNKVFGAVKYKECILTHIPVNENQFYRFHRNIHGHTHSYKLPDKRYICVSAEQIDLTPIEYNKLIKLGEDEG